MKIVEELIVYELVDSVGLSTPYFAQMFRKSTGESPHQFVLQHRIERGKQMLRERQAHVLDVAIACGFKTQQHFARVFRQRCGVSPQNIAKLLRLGATTLLRMTLRTS